MHENPLYTEIPLTEKQQRFAVEYVLSGIGTDSARSAGYKGKHVAKTAYELLKNPNIQAYMEELRQNISIVRHYADFVRSTFYLYDIAENSELPVEVREQAVKAMESLFAVYRLTTDAGNE